MNIRAMYQELALHKEFTGCLNAALDWHSQRIADLTAAIQEAERDRLVMTPDGPVAFAGIAGGDAAEQKGTFGELSSD